MIASMENSEICVNTRDMRDRDKAARELAVGPPHVVVTASSAGGISALSTILSRLPGTFAAPILVVQHRAATPPYRLAHVLGRRTDLIVKDAVAGDKIRPGIVYIASPEAHLVVHRDQTLAYVDGRKIHHLLSSANPLFTSASDVRGDGVIAVVLSGGDSDAAEGVKHVKQQGGIVIAQDDATCDVNSMPRAAIATGCVDYVLPPHQIADALVKLVGTD